ncbi:tektin-4-like [Diachasmimorpha longicaudata]|uniref:tektin-4-like n=1 Tax=Diachasmimorpha longicaudata TaxID=58733 RepID=UPI0030B89B6B
MEETVVSTVCKTQKPEECLANEEFKTGINENSGCLTPSGPFEGCEPPLGEWAGLRKLTGTRPTVGNFTISRYNPQESQKIHEKCLNDSKYRVREAKNQDFKTKLRESQIFSQTDKTQLDNNILLRTRAAAIFHWKTELNFVSQEVESEISKIQGELRRLWSCSQAVDIIRNIGKDIQRIRKPTEQPDLMKDALAEEITKEVKLSNDVLNLYIRCIDETKMQLVELKSAKQRLEHDWSDKSVAYDVDTTCIGLKNNSEILQWKPGSVQVPPDQSTPDGHTSFVKQSIIYAKTAISRSELLRANMKENTTKCLNDLRKQAAAVEIALTDQIVHLTATIKSLETALKECLKRLSDNEILINTTNSAIRGLDGPMKCAQTRLGMRLTRENIENCRDATQKGLIDEAKNIAEGTTALSGQLEAVQDSTKSLIDLRKKLENDLLVKNKKLWIDRERCRVMRSYYPSIHALSGY